MLTFINTFTIYVVRDGNIIHKQYASNAVTTVGKNANLNICFGTTAKPTWYCGLIGGTPTFSVSDTMASHAGWTEYENYDEAVRQTWTPGAASDKAVENATLMDFTIDDATPSVSAIFIADDDTKGGTTGTLWATAPLSPVPTLEDNDVLQIRYKVTIA